MYKNHSLVKIIHLTISYRRPLSKSMDRFLYDNGLRHERVKSVLLPYASTQSPDETKCFHGVLIVWRIYKQKKINIISYSCKYSNTCQKNHTLQKTP